MTRDLTPAETRVLGCLVEKELATPEYYPMTLNALVNACNQKSNRSPVVVFDETIVAEALESLRPLGLAIQSVEGGRAAKFCHNLYGKYRLQDAEMAVLAELLLRGPQTGGELRQRASRMRPLDSMEQVEEILTVLMELEETLVTKLPRQTGRKESRYAHLLSGEPDLKDVGTTPTTAILNARAGNERIENLETEVSELKREIAELKATFELFRQQFE
ncbi:YceH family protein [Geopsychrobacter electrodiphilus]|uniref:YceH family protein n=1 Tax=Geopsychrobacter electrodiphilus TaxID=225196 RepID=UPI000379C313|nr:YceH family protein [Geopsychrobacter electrodiphilus]